MPRVFARVDDVYSLPFLIVEGGTITVKIPQINHNDSFSPSSSPSPSSSLIIVIIIIASSIIVTQRNSPNDLINSLPLFTFSSVTENIVGGDCVVCLSKSNSSDGRRSYSIGSFDYIVDEGYEDLTRVLVVVNAPPGENLASEVAGRSWVRDYVDRLASISSRMVSFSSSSRFFTGSSRQNNTVVAVDEELEANRIGEEISELFWWFSGL
ncbi:E3 ubiquitin-protein ligase ATL4 [Camellia lanceoleosa]|nr:E3 ubiquitin-protein ligase ATL4 [Camellia lanceoleosa]